MSLIVLDHHGDLADLVLASLVASEVDVERVLFFDFANGSYSPTINPLVGDGPVHGRVGLVMSAIARTVDSLGVQTTETLQSVLVALAENGFSLLEVDRALSDPSFRTQLLQSTIDHYAQGFLDRFSALSEELRKIQLRAVLNKLTPLISDPRMRRIIGAGSLEQLKAAVDTTGTVVILCIPGYALGNLAGLLGEVVLGAIWNTVLARASVPAAKRPLTRLVVDEFQLAAGEQFGSMVTEGRRFGLSMVLAHQSQAQVAPTLRALIRNNSAVRLLLSPGVVDAGELAGELAPLPHTEAANELMALKTGEAFLVRRGQRALKILTENVVAPSVSEDELESFRLAAIQNACRPNCDIDAEVAGRRVTVPDPSAKQGTLEVRHERKPWR